MELIIQAGLYLGPVLFMVLFFMSARSNTNNIFLGLSLLCIWGALLINELHLNEKIYQFPYLIRTGNIFAYLIYPFLYLYIRNTFYPGRIWRRLDFLLMVPAAFYIIDMFPFYFLTSAEEKIAITKLNLSNLNRMFKVSEGWIRISGFHLLARYIFSIILLTLCIVMIHRNRRNADLHLEKKFNKPLLFIGVLIILYIPLLLPGVIGAMFHLTWFNLSYLSVSLSITLISVLIFLIFSPDVLYGYLKHVDLVEAATESGANATEIDEKTSLPKPASSFPVDAIMLRVEEYVKEHKPFLQSGYSIHDLSRDTSIPVYQLSYAINHKYDHHFSNWLNHHRIEYFLCLVKEKRNMTLEALAKEAGFANRITFINAFKREKGISPGQYLRFHEEKTS